jgi:hypothetical protein
VDNRGNIVAPFVASPVNVSDMVLFDRSFTNLLETASELDWNLRKSFITLDAGFYSDFNRGIVRYAGMIPVIRPNPGARKDPAKLEHIWNDFSPVAHIYKERYKIERCNAWEDTYRKMVIRYEKLQCTFMGFRYLAYSMINFRNIFSK